jgi:hypothetical protein
MDSRRGALLGALAVPPAYTLLTVAIVGCDRGGCVLAAPGSLALYVVVLVDLGAVVGWSLARDRPAGPAVAALTYAMLGPVGGGTGPFRAGPELPATVFVTLLVVVVADIAVHRPERVRRFLGDGAAVRAGVTYATVAAALQSFSRGLPGSAEIVGWLPFLAVSTAVGAGALRAGRRGIAGPGVVLLVWVGLAALEATGTFGRLPYGALPVVDTLALDPFPDTLYRAVVPLALAGYAGGLEWLVRAAVGRSPDPATPSRIDRTQSRGRDGKQ